MADNMKNMNMNIVVDDGSRRKEYRLTQNGLAILVNEVRRLRELADNGEEILKGEL